MNNGMNLFQIVDMLSSKGGNPEAILQMMLSQNPNNKQAMEQLKNASGGANPEQIAKQLAKQNGISEQQLMQLYNKIHK